MVVLLLNAPRIFFKDSNYSFTTPSLAVAYLDGYLRKHGVDTEVYDLNIELLENHALLDEIKKIDGKINVREFLDQYKEIVDKIVDYLMDRISLKGIDIVGVSVLEAQSLKIILPLVKRIKENYPGIKIIMGGNSVSLVDGEFMDIIDYIVCKEGEDVLLGLIDVIRNNLPVENVNSLIYKKDGKIAGTPVSQDFDLRKQVIHFDKKQVDKYRFTNELETFNDIFQTPILPYSFSKGCPFNCSFCGAALDKVVHMHKDPEQIVGDIKKMVERHRYRYFYFYNMHLNFNKSFIGELCDHIVDSNLDILWSDSIKPLGYMTQKIYDRLREAGCVMLNFGVESGSPKVIKLMRKGHNVDDNSNNLKYAHKAGIWNMTNFLVGFPGEGEKEFEETKSFITKNYDYIDSFFVNGFRLERNYIREHPDEFGIRLRGNMELNNTSNVFCGEYDEIGGLSYEEIIKMQRNRFDAVYRMVPFVDKYKVDNFSHRLTFPLYDILKDKKKVSEFFKKNYDIINRNDGCHSLFVGCSSNQRMHGQLHFSLSENNRVVSYDTLMSNMDRIIMKGYKQILITGGEPLIRKDIFKILNAAKTKGFDHIIMSTNARMLSYPGMADRLGMFVNELLVLPPVSGCPDASYDANAGVEGALRQAQEGITNWKKLGKKIRLMPL